MTALRQKTHPPGDTCGCSPPECGALVAELSSTGRVEDEVEKRVLHIDLLAIDLARCRRCVPTSDQLRTAVNLLAPAAAALEIELRHREVVVRTAAEARKLALLCSPTIRLNGRDIAQDIRESECESCGGLTEGGTSVECREWHYRGRVHPSAPVPLLVEAIMGALLRIEEIPPIAPVPLERLPENLERFFAATRLEAGSPCCP